MEIEHFPIIIDISAPFWYNAVGHSAFARRPSPDLPNILLADVRWKRFDWLHTRLNTQEGMDMAVYMTTYNVIALFLSAIDFYFAIMAFRKVEKVGKALGWSAFSLRASLRWPTC